MKYGHLERIEILLRMLSPLFIGSGEKLSKKEYIFDKKKSIICFPDLLLLMSYLQERKLLKQYERFLTQTTNNDLYLFLKDQQVHEDAYHNFVRYSISAGEAVNTRNFREVLTFTKDVDGRPYIPGSSVKGAIRTAIASQLLESANKSRMQREINTADHTRNSRNYLSRENNRLEQELFCRLGISDPAGKSNLSGQPINDLMRGIQLSDSAPIAYNQLTLAGKYDRKPDGTVKPLPIFRECLLPDTEAKLLLTLDKPILKKSGLNIGGIENALHSFADKHYANFEQYYPELTGDAPIAAQDGVDLILGGGAGYVSKTLSYNLFPRQEALALVAKIMHRQFNRHGHTKDQRIYKVSPHILKTTMYKEQYYQMGRCELIIQ